MKKNITIVVFFIFTFILTWLGYKTLIFINYKVDIEKIGNNTYQPGEVLKIIRNVDPDQSTMIKFIDVYYKDLEGNLILDKDESKEEGPEVYNTYYIEKEDEKNYLATFKVGKSDFNLYDIFSSDEIFVYGFQLKSLNRKKLLDKYNLNNDNDIVRYVIDHRDDEVSIFSGTDEIKMNYFMKTFAGTVIPSSILHPIEGDYKGYIYVSNTNLYYEVHLFNDSKHYVFSFINNKGQDYFNLEDVKEFIKNVQFIE
ncbi:MAG: hypothetical protein PHW32_00870 [Bacilli bacterium]|nr:hypothetical protein [Bacilli bacterium]MDD4283002.1 hypothetical protein [Bacilli bacterium]MDD4718927.1 hypothetical protein [Bacilli bacterium]